MNRLIFTLFVLFSFLGAWAQPGNVGWKIVDPEYTPVCWDSAGIKVQLYLGVLGIVGDTVPQKMGFFEIIDSTGTPQPRVPSNGTFTMGECDICDKTILPIRYCLDTFQVVLYVIECDGSVGYIDQETGEEIQLDSICNDQANVIQNDSSCIYEIIQYVENPGFDDNQIVVGQEFDDTNPTTFYRCRTYVNCDSMGQMIAKDEIIVDTTLFSSYNRMCNITGQELMDGGFISQIQVSIDYGPANCPPLTPCPANQYLDPLTEHCILRQIYELDPSINPLWNCGAGCCLPIDSTDLYFDSADPNTWATAVEQMIVNVICNDLQVFEDSIWYNLDVWANASGEFCIQFQNKHEPNGPYVCPPEPAGTYPCDNDCFWIGWEKEAGILEYVYDTSLYYPLEIIGIGSIKHFIKQDSITNHNIACIDTAYCDTLQIQSLYYGYNSIPSANIDFNYMLPIGVNDGFDTQSLFDSVLVCGDTILTAIPIACSDVDGFLWSTGDTTQVITWDGVGMQPTVTVFCDCGISECCDLCPDPGAATAYTDRVLLCDDINGDTTVLVEYWHLFQVDTAGAITTIGFYDYDFMGTYQPIQPIECLPADSTVTIARRELITGDTTWPIPPLTVDMELTVYVVGSTATPPNIIDGNGDTTALFLNDKLQWTARMTNFLNDTIWIDSQANDTIGVHYTILN